jgi:hypothetical protein
LASVLADPVQARRLSATAATRAAEEYTLGAMVERYLTLYAQLPSPSSS